MNKKIIFILPAAALALTGCTLNPNGGQGNNLCEHSNSGEVQKLRCKNFSIMVDEVIDVTTKITGGEFDVDDVVIEIVEGSEKYIELDGVELTGLKTGEAHILITVGDQELGDVKVTVKEKEEEDLTNYGTEDAPLTTSEAKLIADAQCQTADSFTKKDMYVKGQITNMMGSWDYGETGGAVEFMFSDGTTELHVYRAHAEMSVINQVKNGCNIVIYGEMKNDKRNGLQFADNGASHQVQIKSLTAGTKIEVTGIEFAKPSYELEVGASLEVKASVTPSNATEQGVTYELKNCSPAGCVTLSGNKVTGVAAGTATIVAKSTDKPQFTVEASITVKQGEDLSLKEFKMVTSDAEITSGTYLVSYVTDDKTYVMDGSLSKLDAVNNYVEATNNNGVIAATQDLKNVAVTFDKDTGFLQLPTGDYLDGNLTGNGLKVSTTGVAHEVTYSEGAASIVCGEYTLRFNNGSTQMRFRYYKSGQQAISLFKLVDKEEGGQQAVLDSIEVTTPPTKTAYEEGETFDPTGMVVTAHYTQGKADAIVTGYTYDKTGALAKGDTSITISYTEGSVTKTTTQAITVAESQIPPTPNPVLSSIEVTTQPTKVTYEEGETFDPTGMVVTAHYTEGKTDETVTTYSVDKTGALTTSDTTVTISYTEGTVTVTTTVTITVNEKQQGQRVSIPYSYAITGGALDDKWEQSSTENVKAFATNYIALRASGEWIQAKKLFDSRDSIRVVVTGVCNGTTTDSTVTVYGLDDNGAVVDGAVATYTPVKASASNQSSVDTNAHADAVVLNGTGITGVKIELTTKGHNYVVKQIDFLLPPVSVSSVSLDKTELAMTVNEADEQLQQQFFQKMLKIKMLLGQVIIQNSQQLAKLV